MAILFCVLLLAAALPLLVFCKPRNEHAQEKADPCDKCVRWSECNGVDEDCPLLEEKEAFIVDTEQLAATMREAVRKAGLNGRGADNG